MMTTEKSKMKISLCIPTFNRFDPFLRMYLPKYIENPWIDEIVICDENGEDIRHIQAHFDDNTLTKFVLMKNDTRLYAYRNKEKVVKMAKNDWICLMDSDNFAPISYFEAWQSYIDEHGCETDRVYMPIQTITSMKENEDCSIGFDFSEHLNMTYDNSNIGEYDIEKMGCFLNTGNYIFHRSNFDTVFYDKTYQDLLNDIYAVDVVFKNALMMAKGVKFSVVPNMRYYHIVHGGSFFLNHERQSRRHLPSIYSIYRSFSKR